jgi:hypothetical protein
MFKFLLISFFLILPISVNAGEIEVRGDYILFEGQFKKGSALALMMKIDETGIKKVHLNSPGGLSNEGYLMGNGFRNKNITVVVKENHSCISACAIAFLGSKNQKLEGLIAFHVAHIPKQFQKKVNPSDALKNGQMIGTMTTEYFYRMGYNLQLQYFITHFTTADTFLVFKNLEELHTFKFNEDKPYNIFNEYSNKWMAERISGLMRLNFLKKIEGDI